MNPTKTTDSHSLQNALGKLESIRDLIRKLELSRASEDDNLSDEIQEEAQGMALSVEVRSGWASPGETLAPTEYRILLTYGGPACQITGELSEHGEPETAHLEHQDWGTLWTPVRGCEMPGDVEDMTTAESDLLAFASLFYFGE